MASSGVSSRARRDHSLESDSHQRLPISQGADSPIPADPETPKPKHAKTDDDDVAGKLLPGVPPQAGADCIMFGLLPRNDAGNIILLVLLYLLQGVPVGLAFGTLPFLLKQRLSFAEVGVFSIAGYPYSMKLLWSPIVDSVFSNKLGRRKSWIMPIQLMVGALFLLLRGYMGAVVTGQEPVNVNNLTALWFLVVLLCATQDIAVDGWALTLLAKENIEFGSTCQTIGLNIGYFTSFTVFLALNSADFCNKYLRQTPSEEGLLTLPGYLFFWALFYFALTLFLFLFKRESSPVVENKMQQVTAVYKQIIQVLKLPHMRTLVLVLLTFKIGFIANESVTGLKLLDRGVQKEDLALTVLIDFPFQLVAGYIAARWSSGPRPLRAWGYAHFFRLVFALVGVGLVYFYPSPSSAPAPPPNYYFLLILLGTVLTSLTSTIQFVCMGAFFSRIADPSIGGTYMTLLNTISNLGGTWPSYFVLEAVDYFSNYECIFTGSTAASEKTANEGPMLCNTKVEKTECSALGGTCIAQRDGYFVVGLFSFFVGALCTMIIVLPRMRRLEHVKLEEWRLVQRG